jgi:hypothetical protein
MCTLSTLPKHIEYVHVSLDGPLGTKIFLPIDTQFIGFRLKPPRCVYGYISRHRNRPAHHRHRHSNKIIKTLSGGGEKSVAVRNLQCHTFIKTKMLSLFTLCLLVAVAYGHEVSTGQCPTFPDMKGFDWDRVWYKNGY